MWSFYAPRQVQRSRRMDSFACSFLEKRKFLRFENIFEGGGGMEWKVESGSSASDEAAVV